MTKEEIYEAITNWQADAGEDFLDYFDGDFNAISYMMWCRGKGYITVEQLNAWEKELGNVATRAVDMSAVVHNCHGEDIPYSVVSEDDWTEEGQEKAYGILAEFISESTIYQRRLQKFLQKN